MVFQLCNFFFFLYEEFFYFDFSYGLFLEVFSFFELTFQVLTEQLVLFS